jgi:hypothetical protein
MRSPTSTVERFLEAGIDFEDALQASKLEHGSDAGLKTGKNEARRPLRRILMRGKQRAQPGTVDELNVAQIHNEISASLLEESEDPIFQLPAIVRV